MKFVNTTLGQMNSIHLGKVNIHEHVVIDNSNNINIPEDFHHIDTNLIASDLSKWKVAGGGLIIDSSPIGAGRNIQLLETTSRLASVPLVITTGFHKLSYYPVDHWLYSASEATISDILFYECTEGVLIDDRIPQTSMRSLIKASMIKIGIDKDGITPPISKIISAAGRVILRTGIPCMIHTESGVPFRDVVSQLAENKIPAEMIIFCHMGKSLDTNLHNFLAEKGYYLEFDEMVRPSPPLEQLSTAIIELFNKGYGNSVLFAGDLARYSYWTCYGGKPGLDYLITELDNEFKNLGFSQEMLDQIWIKNPQKLYS